MAEVLHDDLRVRGGEQALFDVGSCVPKSGGLVTSSIITS